MKHKLFTLLIAVMASLGTMFAQSGTCGDNVTWDLTDGVLTISGTGDMYNYGKRETPWDDYRFSILSVIITDGVTTIGNHAFYYCTNLTSIEIPNSVTSVGWRAFNSCSSLISVTIPNNVTSISSEAFAFCSSLSSVSIGKSVTVIGANAFLACEKLTSVNINDIAAWCTIRFERDINQAENMQYANPLYYAGNLYLDNTLVEDLVIPNGVTEIAFQAFADCKSITSVTIPEGVTCLGKGAFLGCSNLSSIKLPTSLTDLGTSTFGGCSNLISVKIPNNVTIIGEYTFDGCTNLTSVVVPSSVTYIGYEAFGNCRSLTSFIDYATKPQSMETPCLTNVPFADATLYVPAESIALYKAYPNWAQFGTIKAIGDDSTSCVVASGTCGAQGDNLTWTLTCDSVLTISGTGAMADYNSSNIPWYEYREAIRSAIIANGVTSIGTNAFYYCRELTSINIPSTVLLIRNYAFFGCQGLTSIEIPNSVTSIGDMSFDICTKLSAIIVAEDNQHYHSQDGVLFTKDATILIYCPRGKQGTYVIPNSVNSIRRLAFKGNEVLTSVEIPNSVTSIGDFAFSACISLNLIIVAPDNSNYSSEDGVLFNKDKTTLIQYPGGKQGAYTIPNSVTSIEEDAFSGCYGITSVITPNSVINIGNEAFRSCFSLASVIIGNSIVNIGDYAFYGCSSITSVTNYATTPQAINANVFNNVDKSACTLYVPTESIEAYQAAEVWKEFGNILAIDDSTEEVNYATLADIYNMAADSTFTLGAFDVMYVPNFQSGSNMYIKDSTGSCVIYKVNYGLQAGDHVEAGLQGKVSIYNGLHEVIPITAKEELTITHGEAPAPMVATEVPSLNNASQYVVYEGVSFTTDTAFVEGRRHTVYGSWNGQTITFYNQYYIGATLSANKTYNITAVNTIYQTTPEAYPLAVEEVTTDTLEPCLIASGTCGAQGDNLTWTLTCDSVLTISGTGEMRNYGHNVLEQSSTTPWNAYLSDIKSAVISEGVTRIGSSAFYNCPNLLTIDIPISVTIIGESALESCTGLTSIEIPNSVTSIGSSAFSSCSNLVTINIPNSVTSIGRYAFADCASLTSIEIPNSVTNIVQEAFAYCISLSSIEVASDNPNYSSLDGVLFDKEKTSLIQYPGGKQGAYTIPNSVTSIENCAFQYCNSLTSVDIPNSVTSIGSYAFSDCSGLTSVEIPNSVISIGFSAFRYCSGLTSIEIPNSVTSIESYAFADCARLTSVTNYATTPQAINEYVFYRLDLSAATLYVPAESIETYKAAEVWKDFGTILPIEEPQGDITVAEAIAIGSALEIGQSTNEEYSVTGYVVNASPFNTQTKDQVWWMADDAENTGAQEFEAYACTVSENNVVMQVLNGDKVTLTGKITKYNDAQNDRTLIEIKNGTAVFVSKVEGKHSIYDTITVAQALEIGAELEAGQSTDKEYVIKGYSTVIQTAHDATYNTESFWIADEKGSKAASNANGAFFVYRGQPDTEKSVGIGALVYVTTKIQRYTDGVLESITKSPVHVEEQGEEEVIPSISVAQALEIGAELAVGAVTDERYEITGYVSNINTFYNADYGNETLWISDDPNSTAASKAEGAFEIYRGKPNTKAEVGYGAKVKITCKIKYYNGTIIENDVVNQPFEVLEESTFVPDTVSAEEAAALVASLSGETSKVYYIVKGFIQSVTTYSANSASFYLSDSKNDTEGAALAYKTAILKADAEKVVEGNYVNVMGYLMERNGVAQIAQGSITAFVEAPQLNKYIITFLNDDGSVVDQREWEEGTLPTCKEPTKEDDDYIYCFIGWNPEIDTVRATATYQAMYEVCGGWLAGDINWRIDHDSLIVSGNGVIPDYEQGAAPWLPYSSRINVIEVKEGITRIGEWAFADMTAKTVHIASSVTVMGANAYKGTSTIDKVVYDGYDYEWANINFVNEYSNPLYYGASFNFQVLHIYPTTTTISTSAFVGMSTIVYHGTVEQWCSMTFTSDYYPSYDLEIDDVIITDLCFGEGLEKISAHAFHGCRSIQRVCIPKSLKQIGQDAFKNMPSLKTVTYAGDLKQWCAITFANAEANPACHADFYFGDEKLGTRLDIPETVTAINAFAFPNTNTLNVYFRSADPAGYELNSFGEPDLVGDKHFYVPCDAKEAYRVRLNYAENLFEEYYQYLYSVVSADEKQGRVAVLHAPTCEEPQLDIQALPNDGFRFVEWSDGNTEAQRSLTLYSDTALKARFDLDSVLIRFLLDDSTLVMEKMFKYGTMPECADPVKEPTAQYTFTFLRWEPEVTVALQDTTYIALFDSVVNSYMVYFINWNGVLLAEQEVQYGSAAVAPEVPAREGYKFVGWNVDINFIVGRTFAVALFEKEETSHGGYTIHYRNTVDDTEIAGETIDLHFPEPPTIEGFVFVGWQAVCDEFIVEGMEIMAVYEPVDPQSTEEVVVNPSNPAQKLFRNGNVYILRDDRTYTVQGQLVK